MWPHNPAIQQPFGVSVFGSALLRAPPDLVSIRAAVFRIEQKPSDAFAKARKGAQMVADFLRRSRVTEVGTSKVFLSQQSRFVAGEQRLVGYIARIEFTLIVRELNRVEDLLTGLVNAGANELGSMSFQTTRLKELRAEVRKMAIAAAREKALIYSEAAGVELGEVVHIEDIDPNTLQGQDGHARREPIVDNDLGKQPLDPGSIDVGAAVLVGFKIRPNNGSVRSVVGEDGESKTNRG